MLYITWHKSAWPVNASCNWVDLFRSVQFSSCACCERIFIVVVEPEAERRSYDEEKFEEDEGEQEKDEKEDEELVPIDPKVLKHNKLIEDCKV